MWSTVALCTILFTARIYIRFACFRRLLAEDYVITVVWASLLAVAAISQRVWKAKHKVAGIND